MIPPTSGIENELAEFLTTAYSGLIREYIFFIAAMLIACAVIPVFIVWMFSRHDRRIIQAGSSCKAYTHKKTTPRGIHTAVIVMMPILALRELRCCLRLISRVEIYGAELIVFCVFLLLLAVLAAVGLFRFRIFGLLLTEAFVLCFAALKQYRNLLAAAADMRDRAQYTTIGQYTLYIVDDYIVTQSMAISFVALAALTLLAVYYYKRRFLFMPGKRSLPCCECCGQVISRGDNFCPCCGKWLRLNPIKQEIISLDQKPFCEKCGSVTFLSVCVNCNKGMDFLLKVTQERVNKMKKSLPRDLIFGAVIIVLIC